jgi:hypothetical protein
MDMQVRVCCLKTDIFSNRAVFPRPSLPRERDHLGCGLDGRDTYLTVGRWWGGERVWVEGVRLGARVVGHCDASQQLLVMCDADTLSTMCNDCPGDLHLSAYEEYSLSSWGSCNRIVPLMPAHHPWC